MITFKNVFLVVIDFDRIEVYPLRSSLNVSKWPKAKQETEQVLKILPYILTCSPFIVTELLFNLNITMFKRANGGEPGICAINGIVSYPTGFIRRCIIPFSIILH
jgi:hypothetical protein